MFYRIISHPVTSILKTSIVAYGMLILTYTTAGWIHGNYCVPNTWFGLLQSAFAVGSPACGAILEVMTSSHQLAVNWWTTLSVMVISSLTTLQKVKRSNSTNNREINDEIINELIDESDRD